DQDRRAGRGHLRAAVDLAAAGRCRRPVLRRLQRDTDHRPPRRRAAPARRGPLRPGPRRRPAAADTVADPARPRLRGIMTTAPKVALITGATQGLGLALAEGLAQRLTPQDTVYLTGRDLDRVTRAVDAMPGGGAQVRGELLDVADPHAAVRL